MKDKLSINNDSGGALLFALIVAFLISFTTVALVALTMNQAKVVYKEGDRLMAKRQSKAATIYAFNKLLSGEWEAREEPYIWEDMNIYTENDGELSEYKVRVIKRY